MFAKAGVNATKNLSRTRSKVTLVQMKHHMLFGSDLCLDPANTFFCFLGDGHGEDAHVVNGKFFTLLFVCGAMPCGEKGVNAVWMIAMVALSDVLHNLSLS